MSIIFKIYGTVSYDDNSWSTIDITHDSTTHMVGTRTVNSESFRNMSADSNGLISAFMHIAFHNSLSFDIDEPEINKTVTGYNLSISGTVANENGSVQSFYALINDTNGIWYTPSQSFHNAAVDAFVTYDRNHENVVIDIVSTLAGLAGYV